MPMKTPIALPASTVSRNALVLIAVVAGGAAVYWLRGILTPLAMAIFLMIMIDGVKRSSRRAPRCPITLRAWRPCFWSSWPSSEPLPSS